MWWSAATPCSTRGQCITYCPSSPVPLLVPLLPSFLKTLVDEDNAELFDNFIASSIVQFKWQAYGRRKFFQQVAWYVMGLVLVTALTFILRTDGRDVGALFDGDALDVASVAVTALLALMALWDLRWVAFMSLCPTRARAFVGAC